MTNLVQRVAMDKLEAHPDNPNQQSKANFCKLIRNVERTGRYEPILVRPHPEKENHFQIINGHHRRRALEKLGYEEADCIVWDVDDEQTDILLATVNRLCGTDKVRNAITEDASLGDLKAAFQQEIESFKKLRKQYLIY